MTRQRGQALAIVALAVAAGAGCGGDDDDDSADVAAACDRLEALAVAVADLDGATSGEDMRAALAAPIDAFAEAADDADDDLLEPLADAYRSYWERYLTTGDEAFQTAADEALDGAGARCIELGADNVFPREP